MKIYGIYMSSDKGDTIEDFAQFMVETAKAYNVIVTGKFGAVELKAAKWTRPELIVEFYNKQV